MNIAYLYPSVNPLKGGVERVTYTVSKWLINLNGGGQNHRFKCFFIGLKNSEEDEAVMTYLPDTSREDTPENVSFFLDWLKRNEIDIVINQGAMPGSNSCALVYHAHEVGVKVVNCIHQSLLDTIRNFTVTYRTRLLSHHLLWLSPILRIPLVNKVIVNMYLQKVRPHFDTLVNNSDAVVLLSPSFKPDLETIVGRKVENVFAIPNPLSFQPKRDVDFGKKKKAVLYVGRIDTIQKKVDLLLCIWSKVCHKHTDWCLKIVGYGGEVDDLKQLAKRLNCINYSFEGKQEPIKYYEEASIFTMTSSYEGFGIVLVEALQMGVVPIAFDSYCSAKDIIEDGRNGYLVRPFEVESYANKLELLMNSNDERQVMAERAILSARKFSIEKVGCQWVELFEKLKDKI